MCRAVGGLARVLASLPPDNPARATLAAESPRSRRNGRLASAEPAAAQNPQVQGMIAGMVEGLAARLAKSPDDPDGWVRLVRPMPCWARPPSATRPWAALRPVSRISQGAVGPASGGRHARSSQRKDAMIFWPKSRQARTPHRAAGRRAGAGLAVGLALFGLRDSISLFYTPARLRRLTSSRAARCNWAARPARQRGQAPRRRCRLRGRRPQGVGQGDLSRRPAGPVREGQGIVAEGSFDPNGVFVAKEVLAKHDERYMPRDVAKALKKQGEWRGEGASAPAMEPEAMSVCPFSGEATRG